MFDGAKELSKLPSQVVQALGPFYFRGDMAGAMRCMASIPEAQAFLAQYVALFVHERYLHYDIPQPLNEILLLYQQYFRSIFYLGIEESDAAAALLRGLQSKLGLLNGDESALAAALEHSFHLAGYHFLGGKTSGHYGPYIWKTTVPTTFTVELPDTTSRYTVNILRDFLFRSWMDYLTFGAMGTGGWTSPDGTIHCVEKAYDFESESFQVSLLKHEAQHAEDLRRWPEMQPQDLEYRAKLVELIYTKQTDLLEKFMQQADQSRTGDGHALASARIAEEFQALASAGIPAIQEKARALFARSTVEMTQRYGAPASEAVPPANSAVRPSTVVWSLTTAPLGGML